MIPTITFLTIYKTKQNPQNIFCAGGQAEDEDKQNNSKTLLKKLSKIEKKLDYLLENDKFKISVKDYPRFPKGTDSLLKKILDESTWKRNLMLLTEEGYTINDIIQPGLDTQEHPIGLVAVSKDSYFTFEDLLINSAKIFHNRNINLTKFEMDNYQMIKTILNSNEELLNQSIEGLELTTHRNIDNYIFSSKISRADRRELARVIFQVLKAKEGEIFENTGKFLNLDSKGLNITGGVETNQFFRACGFYRDWPDGRFIYVNNDSLTMVVNEEDHLKLLYKEKDNSFNIKSLLSYFDLLEALGSAVNFSYDNYLGYLTSLPNCLGSGCYFTIRLKVSPKNIEPLFNQFKSNQNLLTKKTENGLEITNVTSFFTFSHFLIELLNVREMLINDK